MIFTVLMSSLTHAKVQANISSLGDAVHLEFKGQSKWNYNLKKVSPKKVSLVIPKLDQASKDQLLSNKYKKLIKSIYVSSKNKSEDELVLELASSRVESFDYLTDQPSRLIIDFYEKEIEKTKSKKQKSKLSQKKIKKTRKPAWDENLKPGLVKSEEEPALVKTGLYDAADPFYKRFKISNSEISKKSILESQNNIYVHFPVLTTWYYDLDSQLDRKLKFVIQPDGTKENNEARLLVNLYKKQRYARFLKAYKYFTEQYPKSRYNQIVNHLAAETYFRNWKKTGDEQDYKLAEDRFKYLKARFNQTQATERSILLMAYSQIERGNYFEAIKNLQEHKNNYPQSKHRERTELAIADTLIQLGRYKEAIKLLKSLSVNIEDSHLREVASVKVADAHFVDKNFARAKSLLKKARAASPKLENTYPSLLFNLAESYFWQGNYKKSLDTHIKFIKAFPSHKYGNYSLTRIGENLDILGADKKRSMNAYLESHFRYPEEPGAKIAKVRMLTQRMPVMKPAEAKRAQAEIIKIGEDSQLKKSLEFSVVMASEGLRSREQYEDSIKILNKYYKAKTLHFNEDNVRKKIVDNVVSKLIKNKKGISKELQDLDSYAATWLRGVSRADFDYHLARVYSKAGAPSGAIKNYEKALSKMQKMKNLEVLEKTPNKDTIKILLSSENLRIKNYKDSLKWAKAAKESNLDSFGKVQRIQILSKLSLLRGYDNQVADDLEIFISDWKNDPKYLSPLYIDAVQLNLARRNFSKAKKFLGKLSKQKLSASDEERYLSMKIKSYLDDENPNIAISSLKEYLKKYPKNKKVHSFRYKLGEKLFNEGKFAKAKKTWSPLEVSSPVYWRLADEKLQTKVWSKNYKKYIKRIPASKSNKERF